MASDVALPLVVPADTGQRFSCHSCTRCCRDLVVSLTDDDRRRIDSQGWAAKLESDAYVRLGADWVLNKRGDGACVFLMDDGRCRIHAEHGLEAKPLACRLYPFTFVPGPKGRLVTWRFDCPTVARSQGQPAASHLNDLRRWARQLRQARDSDSGRVKLTDSVEIEEGQVARVIGHFDGWLSDARHSLQIRLLAAVLASDALVEAASLVQPDLDLSKLLDEFIKFLPGELEGVDVAAPSPRQRGMLRQLVFAHAEHLTLDQMLAGRWARLRRRGSQLRAARRLRVGRGVVPRLAGVAADPSFEAVEAVGAAEDERPMITELIVRYLRTRLLSRTCFGAAYYHWPLVDGLAALWLSVAAIGWTARYLAAGAGRTRLVGDDVVTAVGVIDRSAGRAPSLGSRVERLRLRYLRMDQGVGQLLCAYSLVDESD